MGGQGASRFGGAPPAGNGGMGGTGGAGAAAILAQTGSTVSITGGTFNFGLGGAGGSAGSGSGGVAGLDGSSGANGFTLVGNGGSVTLFGTFTGGARVLTPGTGTFTGTLTNDTAAQTFTHNDMMGTITLANAVPEPSTWALLFAGAGLLGLMLRRRRAGLAR